MINKVLVKLSGESLNTDLSTLENYSELAYIEQEHALSQISGFGIANKTMVLKLTMDIKRARDKGTSIAIVIGGGNLCRGTRDSANRSLRTSADQIGMLATVINGLVLHAGLGALGVPSVVLSTRSMPAICELYTAEYARSCMTAGKVAICVGGTGQPFFSTDTAAVIRACELGCDVLLKATKVAGIYESDPVANPHALFLDALSYDEFLSRQIRIMDTTAISIAQQERLVIYVSNTYADNAIVRTLNGELKKSVITGQKR
ncbi:MAG: hypothetical protein LBR89_04840 [Holosporales bacterium]|jgi:uridylate kinase|nr:hypothetical protein [Holosporales bacterium]